MNRLGKNILVSGIFALIGFGADVAQSVIEDKSMRKFEETHPGYSEFLEKEEEEDNEG